MEAISLCPLCSLVAVVLVLVVLVVFWFYSDRQINHKKQTGSSPVVPTTVAASSDTIITTPFHGFIQSSVIDKFEDQRHGDHAEFQFAVLFLSSERTIRKLCANMEFRNTHPLSSKQLKLTDSNFKTFPPDANIVNYVTARPNKSPQVQVNEHAEYLLLGKLETLMNAFGESKCQIIVLYTWLLPCESCKDMIVEKLGRFAKSKTVILAYTSTVKDMEQSEANKILKDLKSAGIDVRNEQYHKKLEPKTQ